jgi:dTDP-4-dehydrorhamnose reductase
VDKSLVNTRSDFSFEVKSYPTQVKEMKEWIYAHESFYGERYFGDKMMEG